MINIVVRVVRLTLVNFLETKLDVYALVMVRGMLGMKFSLFTGFHELMFMVLETCFWSQYIPGFFFLNKLYSEVFFPVLF
jgi:hypothetical protein